jgi:hypothetical protein
MGWWSSFVHGVQVLGTGLSTGVKKIWNNVSVAKVATGAVTYTANTGFQILEEVLALRKAVPTLIYNPEARKIVYGMGYILVWDVMPFVALHWGNNTVQNYFRKDHPQEDWYAPYSLFLSLLTVMDCSLTVFTWRQGTQAFVRNAIIDSLGPAAFNSNKTVMPKSLCTELKCNYKRKAKGMLREPLILLANDVLVVLIKKFLPYGVPISTAVSIFFHGRYQYRLTTPERCERHKAMMQEEVLALGLTYQATNWMLEQLLESTVGPTPFLYQRALSHLLLLLHINVAAHMHLPLVEQKDATLPIDPLNIYERVCRFFADVLFAGLMKRIPIDFKLEQGSKPIIPLSTVFQWGTQLLNSDKETEQELKKQGYLSKTFKMLRTVFLPSILHNPNGFIRDPIVTIYWPTIRQGGIAAAELIESVGQSKKIQLLAWAPKSVATALNLKFGIPKKLTRVILRLSQEQDFWNLVDALKMWFERHNVKTDVLLTENKTGMSLTRNDLIPLPKQVDVMPTTSGQLLHSERTNTVVVNARDLIPSKEIENTVIIATELIPQNKVEDKLYVATSADSLFSTRRRKANKKSEKLTIELLDPVSHYSTPCPSPS